jgi:hypothetical protein
MNGARNGAIYSRIMIMNGAWSRTVSSGMHHEVVMWRRAASIRAHRRTNVVLGSSRSSVTASCLHRGRDVAVVHATTIAQHCTTPLQLRSYSLSREAYYRVKLTMDCRLQKCRSSEVNV